MVFAKKYKIYYINIKLLINTIYCINNKNEVIDLMVAKSVSIELDDLLEIDQKIKRGEVSSLSAFIRDAIKNELKSGITI